MRDKILIRSHPNQNEMNLVEEARGMILSFMYQPDSVIDGATSKAFLEGWLAGLGLKPHHRLALIMVPKVVADMEAFKEQYIDNLLNVAIFQGYGSNKATVIRFLRNAWNSRSRARKAKNG